MSSMDAFMRLCSQPVALFCRGYTADGKVIDVVLRDRQENTRYQLRQRKDDTDWVLVRFIVMEVPVKATHGYRMQATEFMKPLGRGTLAEMKRLTGTLTPQAQSA